MTQQDRLSVVLERLATGTNVLRTRAYDDLQSQRNGEGQADRLEAALVKLEGVADDLWSAIQVR